MLESNQDQNQNKCDTKNYGYVYFYNMTDRTMHLVVNEAKEDPLFICGAKYLPDDTRNSVEDNISVEEGKGKVICSNPDGDDVSGVDASQADKSPNYIFFSKRVLRDAKDKPEGPPRRIGKDNGVVFWLANDNIDNEKLKKEFKFSLDFNEPGEMPNQDLEVFIFNDRVIVRVDGNAAKVEEPTPVPLAGDAS